MGPTECPGYEEDTGQEVVARMVGSLEPRPPHFPPPPGKEPAESEGSWTPSPHVQPSEGDAVCAPALFWPRACPPLTAARAQHACCFPAPRQ